MIETYCSDNIVNIFTHCSTVKEVYTYGQLVWPTEPSYYYIKWSPDIHTGLFEMEGKIYNFSDYPSGFSGFSGTITDNAFSKVKFSQIKTNALSIGLNAFCSCSSLSKVSLPFCEFISYGAFYGCLPLSQISLPKCSYIGNGAFNSCSSLLKVNLPMCISIGNSAFYTCSSLSQISIKKCSYIGKEAFYGCHSLSQISLPACSYIGSSAFVRNRFSSINLPVCEYIGDSAFYSCNFLSQVNLPACSYIGDGAFYTCRSLNRITIGYSSICSLYGSTVFDRTKITSSIGSIYVPASLVNSYKKATNWSYFSSRIFPIES